jgi:hypothetical protein
VLFNDHLYRALLDLPPGATATPATAARVQGQIERFLHRAGYELATVRAEVVGTHVRADIDEGQLDDVVILGVGGWDSVRFHLDLDLPHDVYNTPLLDERLRLLCLRYGSARCTATLAPVDALPGSQLGTRVFEYVGGLGGTQALLPEDLVREGRAQRLLIRLEHGNAKSGFWPTLDVGLPDGVTIGADGLLTGFLSQESSTDLKLRAGANTLGHLDGSGQSLVLTHGIAEARMHLPAPFGIGVKPAVFLGFDMVTRQRGDLGVDRVMQAHTDLAAAVDLAAMRGLALAAGLGVSDNRIFGLSTFGPVDPTVTSTPSDQLRPFALVFAHVDFTPDQLRVDRHHEIFAFSRLRTGSDGVGRAVEADVDGRYQLYRPFGYNELWLRVHGQLHMGDVHYTDEQSLASELRGNLGTVYFHDAATALVEVRLSIVRELLKISVWGAGGACGQIVRREPVDQPVQGYGAVGLGLHGLAWSVAAGDVFIGVGFSSDGSHSFALTLDLHEAFH